MDFGDADTGIDECVERGFRLFKFKGKMAGVIIDADAFLDGVREWVIEVKFVEESESFFGVFKQTERFRL